MIGPVRSWSAWSPLLWGILTLVLLVGVLGAWSVFTTISGAVIAPGQIEVAQNRQVVQHPDGGVVAQIRVVEGSQVTAGDVLIRLDGTLLASESAIVENQLLEILARRARLEAERDGAARVVFPPDLLRAASERPEVAELSDGQIKLFDVRRETLTQQIDQRDRRIGQITSQIEGIDAQSTALKRQLALLHQELVVQRRLLAKGLAHAARVLELEREQARLDGQVGDLRSSRAQAEGKITEIEIEKLGLVSQRQESAASELRDVGYHALELAERHRSLAERVARLDIRAPVSGVVMQLQVTTPRAVIRPADPVLYLIPQDRPLVIVARVPTTQVDELHLGQDVRLHFSAFSSRSTPELTGQLSVLSADVLQDDQTQAPYYRAEITLAPGEREKLDGEALLPGMPVEVFIRTQDRTPLAYLLKPFSDYLYRAFRES